MLNWIIWAIVKIIIYKIIADFIINCYLRWFEKRYNYEII